MALDLVNIFLIAYLKNDPSNNPPKTNHKN